MYSTCLFCHQDLGANEVVEHFPVGRRLAFDAAKGRLWVVCRKCERWNLTPLEERWEAIEECERVFAETRLRVSTDNIGLARLREGLELVRIGSALRPEMAAWRYGDQFGRRRVRHMLWTGAGFVAVGGIMILGPATGILAGAGWGTWQVANGVIDLYKKKRTRLKLMLPGDDDVVTLRKSHLEHTALLRDEAGWLLNLSYEPKGSLGLRNSYTMREIRGDNALRVAGQVLPQINVSGASQKQVQESVKVLERYGTPERVFESQAWSTVRSRLSGRKFTVGRIATFPTEVRLALEMAAHEEQERRALEGELAILEAAWREAEIVAKIADDMFLPADAEARLAALKKEG